MNGLGALAGYLFYFCYLGVVGCVHQLTLAYQDFRGHLGEASWTLAYVAPSPVKALRVSLVHYHQEAPGRFVADACLNTAQVPPTKSAGHYLIRIRYREDHTAIIWSEGSSESGAWQLPLHYAMQKRLVQLPPGSMFYGWDRPANPSRPWRTPRNIWRSKSKMPQPCPRTAHLK